VARFCENDNESSGSIKGSEFLNQMSDCQLLKNGPAKWISLFN
jgi:hypothetical protein